MAVAESGNIDTRYIYDYSQKGVVGYLVKVPIYKNNSSKNESWHTKLFAFSKYESESEALEQALGYRDSWFAENQDKSRIGPNGIRLLAHPPTNNTSGIIGVNRTTRTHKNGSVEELWQATFRGINGRPATQKFSVQKLGETEALKRAVAARRDGLLSIFTTLSAPDSDQALEKIAFYDDIISNLSEYIAEVPNERSLVEIAKDESIQATSKLNQILVRLGQQRFRRKVLAHFHQGRAVTGAQLIVRASHIKPWHASSDEEKLGPNNGLALSPTLDAAFDCGLISFADDGIIIVSERFKNDAALLGVKTDGIIRDLTDGHRAYLSWHRTNIFMDKADG